MPRKDPEARRAYMREYTRKRYAADPGYKARQLARVRRNARSAYDTNKTIVAEAKCVPCTDCGDRYPPYVMDFDHVRGEKVMDVSRMLRHSTAALVTEIEKCDVVCANCHRERTHAYAMISERGVDQSGRSPGS